jgi:Fe2+ or Zn2+ uptake regulation protein
MKTHFYRKDILKVCHKWHLKVEEIYEKILVIHPNASRSSIYRNVDDMVCKWELKKLEGVWKSAYYEKNIWEHVHIIDTKTGSIMDLDTLNIDTSHFPKNFKVHSLDIKVFWEFSS